MVGCWVSGGEWSVEVSGVWGCGGEWRCGGMWGCGGVW